MGKNYESLWKCRGLGMAQEPDELLKQFKCPRAQSCSRDLSSKSSSDSFFPFYPPPPSASVMWNTSDANFSCYHESVLGYCYVAVTVGGVGAMTGTMGNMLTLLALAIQPKFCTHFNLLIANLEVADLFYGTLF